MCRKKSVEKDKFYLSSGNSGNMGEIGKSRYERPLDLSLEKFGGLMTL